MQRKKLPEYQGELPKWAISINELVYDKSILEWCKFEYPGHKQGCPMYNTRETCPPQASFINTVFDFTKPIILVHSEFDLESHVKSMQKEHPEWSLRKCKCVLYWQRTSRKQMMERAAKVIRIIGGEMIHPIPEASGVHVYATALNSGLKLEKIRNIKICRHIAFIGWKSKKLKLKVRNEL